MKDYMTTTRKLDEHLMGKLGVTFQGDRVSFGYIRNGERYAEKTRDEGKNFSGGGSKTLYNVDSLSLGGVAIITEGEIDCISCVQAGFDKSVSLSSGWGENANHSQELVDNIDLLLESDYVVVAGDNDRAGSSLPKYVSNLLVGQDVRYVTWPEGCKDANDVHVKYGLRALFECIEAAVSIDPEGGYITGLSDLPPLSGRRVLKSGIDFVDERVAWELGAMSVVTGYPGCGKSTLTTWLAYHVAKREKIKVGMFSFETHPYRTRDHLCRMVCKTGWDFANDIARKRTVEEGDKYFRIVHRTFNTKRSHNLNWLLDNIEVLATRDGCKLIIIDPWNELEHLPEPGESLTNYINFALQQIRGIAEKLEIHIVVVAHPKKPNSDAERMPGGYDIADSAAFYNKPSLGLSIGSVNDQLMLQTWKVRDTQLYGIHKGSTDVDFIESTMSYDGPGSAAFVQVKETNRSETHVQ